MVTQNPDRETICPKALNKNGRVHGGVDRVLCKPEYPCYEAARRLNRLKDYGTISAKGLGPLCRRKPGMLPGCTKS